MKVIFNLLFFILTLNNLFAKNDSLNLIIIKNQSLIEIIDKFIENEKKCDYYNCNLVFSINVQVIEKQSEIIIESQNNIIIKLGNELGYFEHKGHLFLLYGNSIDSTLFSLSNEFKSINYHEPQNRIDTKTGMAIIEIFEDDSYTIWVFEYNNNIFKLIEENSYCN